jgi:hypothetical protein
MTAPAAPARLTIHDQLMINLCGWLAHAWSNDPNLELNIGLLRRCLPSVNHGNPLIGRLADAATALLDLTDRRDVTRRNIQALSEAQEMKLALMAIFATRAAQACAQIWPDENVPPTLPEEASHAAE